MNNTQVLIVEDKSQIALDIQDCLLDLGYSVSGITASGEESLKLIDLKVPDVVLMDIHLRDEMDGIEAAQHIINRYHVPVIFLSAYADEDLVERAKRIESYGYLIKPIKDEELRATIEMTMYRSQMERERQQLQREVQRAEAFIKSILESVIPTCVTNTAYNIIHYNKAYSSIFGIPSGMESKCYYSRPGSHCETDNCPLNRILAGENEVTCEVVKKSDTMSDRTFLIHGRPLRNEENEVIGIVETFEDITTRLKSEREKELLIEQLQKALKEVKTLKGIIPICMHCKSIRDDKGYWDRIEKYILEHSDAQLSHGICETCMKKYYPEFAADWDEERTKSTK